MPRRPHKARKHYERDLTFKEVCYLLGITPMQRTLMIREIKKRVKGKVRL